MLTEEEKTQRLEQAVISKSPEEIKRVYGELGEVRFTAYALGLACRYRGLDTVKALVECGADFRYPDEADLTDNGMRFSYGYRRVRFLAERPAAHRGASRCSLSDNKGDYSRGSFNDRS